jgi:septal ring factor EnvC (AmiA/AmiB activator)
MAPASRVALFFLVALAPTNAFMAETKSAAKVAANPMRRVITMLQMMVKKVEAEGKKETELFEKFMCYCKSGKETLGKSIADAEEKIPQLESDIKEAVAEKAQLDKDLETHKADRETAKSDIAKASAMREKDAAAFLKESTEDKSNLEALKKALAAIEKGMAGAFLQTNSAAVLRRLSLTQDMSNADRDLLSSFLVGGGKQRYAPASGEIVGILKQMGDTMEKDLAEVIAAEDAAKQDFEGLVAAKEKEIAAATKNIEEKTKRTGEVAVEIVNLKEDLDDTSESLAEDQKFLADLEKNCETKKKEWAEICKMRQEELVALADTIKILNDDDAQELFKKSIPSASASLLQVEVTQKQIAKQALKALSLAKRGGQPNVNLDLIELALQGKKVSFDKVIAMINDMVVLLGKEQVEDDTKKTYCETEFDKADDKKKELELTISDLEKAIDEIDEGIATLTTEIKALEEGIVKLDREVAEATVQRKEEHADFEAQMASNTAVIQIIGVAKNRLNKFYNPKLYKPPPKRELSEEERITLNMGGTLAPTNPPGGIAGTGISFLGARGSNEAPPPPPPEAPGPYKKKGEESGGVLAMMDMMKAEVEKESQEAEFAEKDAQGEYEQMVLDAAAKRAADLKSIAEKEAAKAGLEEDLIKTKDEKKAKTGELMATKEYISELHADCDWLLEKYDIRKEARAGEIEALKKAVAVLSGADYSL